MKPKRPSGMDDTARALIHRSNTPARGGVVADFIDEEVTPPPQTPPSGPDLDVEAVLSQHAEAIAKVWDARNLRDSVITIGKDLSAISELMRAFVVPAVKNMQGRLETIERANEANRGRQDRFFSHEWPMAMKTLETIGTNMGRIEKDVDRVERSLDQYMKRSDTEKAEIREKLAGLVASDGRTEVRLRSLEDFALTLKVKVAAYSAMLGFIGAIIWWVVQKKLSL